MKNITVILGLALLSFSCGSDLDLKNCFLPNPKPKPTQPPLPPPPEPTPTFTPPPPPPPEPKPSYTPTPKPTVVPPCQEPNCQQPPQQPQQPPQQQQPPKPPLECPMFKGYTCSCYDPQTEVFDFYKLCRKV